MKINLQNVFTASEAAERWGLHNRTVTNACTGQKGLPPRFHPDECRKAGAIWLVSRNGMERLYGEEKQNETV